MSTRKEIDTSTLPKARSAAKELGFSHYFTGEPCKHGHVDRRLASTGACAECIRVRQRARLANDPAYRELFNKSCLKRINRLLTDPEKKAEIRARERERARRPDVVAKQKQKDKIRNSKPETKARRRLNQKNLYHAKKNDPNFIAKARANYRQHYLRNKDEIYVRTSVRRVKRKNAMPDWLLDSDKRLIDETYRTAKFLSDTTGVHYEVDHIIPLDGEFVCGLHVPWNLQILTRTENRSKRASIPFDQLRAA